MADEFLNKGHLIAVEVAQNRHFAGNFRREDRGSSRSKSHSMASMNRDKITC